VYAEHIKRRLGTIIHWETSVRNAIDNSRKSLKALEEFFSAPLPKELNEEIVARWEHDQENLKGIGELLGPPENKPNEVATADSVDQEVSELRDTLARIKRRAEEWRARITDLRDEFDKSLNQAREFIAEQKLEFDPVRADDLEKPWGAAANAGSALEQALVIWPDAQDALKLSQTVQDWVKKASTLARDYFEREVSRASQIWTAERTRVANITTNGTEHGVPNPYPAGDVLDNALDYWKRNEVLIRKLDKNGADALNLKAEALKGELIAAKDRYNAKMRTPTPQPTASP
jgi:chromosome segregation ATPase